MSSAAQAATVAYAGTGSLGDVGGPGSVGGFTYAGGGATTDWVVGAQPGVWTNAVTTPASYWVLRGDPTTTADVDFEYSFDLTGYDLATVSVDIQWSVDNSGNIDLNGVFQTLAYSNYTALQSVTMVGPTHFNAGLNTLTFKTAGDGATDGMRAAVTVTADVSAVPIPATLPLLLGAVGLLALRRRG